MDVSRGPRIAVDLMGGDLGPEVVLDGALDASKGESIELVLVGDERLERLVPTDTGAEFIAADAAISMGHDPEDAVREMRDSSLVRTADLARKRVVDAVVTTANTGAAVLATTTRLGRIPRVAHPVIAGAIRNLRGGSTVLVDSGATIDPPASWLPQFAAMGAAYVRARFGIEQPRIGLLCNGAEEIKGDAYRQAARGELARVEGFVGFIEGYDLSSGEVDVVVTDGFAGNVALKSYEAGMRSAVARLAPDYPGGRDAALRALRDGIDLGAVLLGVRGVVVILHGAAPQAAITSGVQLAASLVRNRLVDLFRSELHRVGA